MLFQSLLKFLKNTSIWVLNMNPFNSPIQEITNMNYIRILVNTSLSHISVRLNLKKRKTFILSYNNRFLMNLITNKTTSSFQIKVIFPADFYQKKEKHLFDTKLNELKQLVLLMQNFPKRHNELNFLLTLMTKSAIILKLSNIIIHSLFQLEILA